MLKLINEYLLELDNEYTRDNYRIDLEGFSDFIKDMGLSLKEVSQLTGKQYARHLKDQYAPATTNRKLQSVRSFYNHLINEKVVEDNPFIRVKGAQMPKRLPRPLGRSEAMKLLQVVDSEKNEFLRVRNKLIINIALFHGLRVAEITKLRLQDFREDRITFIGKGNKERGLILSEEVMKSYNDWLEVRESTSDRLLVGSTGKPLSVKGVQKLAKNYLIRAGLKDYSIHNLRDTAATTMLDMGVDISGVQSILGHSDISTTKIYAEVTDKNKRDIAQKMTGAYN